MRVLHGIFIALGLLTLAWAAPAGIGVASESGPAQRDPSGGGGSGGRTRYVFLGGFHGGK
jgi:hypothetical protein